MFTPKIKRKFFDFYILWIKTNVAYTRLELIARTNYCTTTTASKWFVTLYYKLLPAVRSSSKHGRRWSSLLLYSISMIHNFFHLHIHIPPDQLCRSHIMQYCCGYCRMAYPQAATAWMVPTITVAAEYPHSTLKGTPTCSSHRGTALYETYVAGWRNLDVYTKMYGMN